MGSWLMLAGNIRADWTAGADFSESVGPMIDSVSKGGKAGGDHPQILIVEVGESDRPPPSSRGEARKSHHSKTGGRPKPPCSRISSWFVERVSKLCGDRSKS